MTNYERIAEAIKIRVRLLRDELAKEQEFQRELERTADDSYPMGVSVGKKMRLSAEIDYLEMIESELMYG